MLLRYMLVFCLLMPGFLRAQDKDPKKIITITKQEKGTLKINPNPAKTFANIYVEWPSVRNFTISVYDIAYKAAIQEWKVEARKSYEYSLDMTKLPNGSKYKVIVKSSDGVLEEELNIAR